MASLGYSRSAPSLEDAFARLRDQSMKTCYMAYHSYHKPEEGASQPKLAPKPVDAPDNPLSREDMKKLMQDVQRGLLTTTYNRMYPDYGSKAKPAMPKHRPQAPKVTAKEERLKGERRAAKMLDIQLAMDREQQNRSGAMQNANLGFSLTAPLEPPKPSMHANYVGGLPPINWKSESRSNLHVEVHSRTSNKRYGQPQQISTAAASQHGTAPC
uniref:Uncharacterized protein n=1 Tax=Alexandrium andersonii TaxID=327968 RepID=A0A7S2DEK2_9DINO|mmetsp:Transcript_52265/g.118008  ORF Transcript_52265/g.118008 Transcript_52265/m.118008 type:complete len:213 (+) Transcript_52265:87-725(+)